MDSNLKQLDILPVNKTVVFYSPMEGRDILVRTGVISSDKNCLLHAVLHGYSKEYTAMNEKDRGIFVKKLTTSSSSSNDILFEKSDKGVFIEKTEDILDGILQIYFSIQIISR